MKTIEEKAKAYDEIIERAKTMLAAGEVMYGKENNASQLITDIIPELRESEDERMMLEFNDWLCEEIECRTNDLRDEKDRRTLNMLCYVLTKVKDWLEKQKEPTKEELYAEAGTTEKEYIANTMKMVRAMREKKQEQKPISSCDIVPYIDEKIAALQDMWREEKVSFDWDDMKDMIEDVARHFYHKEQKPSTGIYWHAIKRGDKIPCRAYLYKVAYETENNFGGRATIDGLLVPNIENVTCGCDTWYLPADDVKNLPREGLDELQKVQKPNSTEDMPYIADERFYEREPADSFKYKLAEYMTKCCTKKEGPYGYTYGISAESILKMAEEELLKRGVVQKPAEWSGFDKGALKDAICATDILGNDESFNKGNPNLGKAFRVAKDWLKSLPERFNLTPKQEWSEEDKQWLSEVYFAIDHSMYSEDERQAMKKYIDSLRPSWKPSEEQMKAFRGYIEDFQARAEAAVGGWNNFDVMIRLYEQLKKL